MKKVNKKSKGKKMNENDKIDLKDVNKKKASSKRPSLTTFKKQKGPKRDEVGKFAATTGSGGLKSIKSFNWKRAFPIIAVIAVVGGFLVYQSFAATNTGSRGGPENHNGSRGCTNLPAKYVVPYEERALLGRSIGEGMVKGVFMKYHGRIPTVDELIYWTTTRTQELKQQYGSNCVAISYIGYLEMKALKTFGVDAEVKEAEATRGADVIKSIYATDIYKRLVDEGSRRALGAKPIQRAGTDKLPVMEIGNLRDTSYRGLTRYANRWEQGWPEKIKICALVYRPGVVSGQDYNLKLTASARSKSVKTFDLDELTNIATAQRYTETPVDGRTRTVYPMETFELCSDYVSKTRAGSNTRSPDVYSVSVDDLAATRSKRMLLEAYYIKK